MYNGIQTKLTTLPETIVMINNVTTCCTFILHKIIFYGKFQCMGYVTPRAASKKKQDTKDSGKGKSTKCAQNAIRHLSGTFNSEKIKPVALAIISLHLSEGISQSVK